MDGTWAVRGPGDGTTQTCVGDGGDQKAALIELCAALSRVNDGAPARDAKTSLGEWAAVWRTSSLPASNRAGSTIEMYARLCRRWVESGSMAEIRLDRLKPVDVRIPQLLRRKVAHA